MCFGKKDHYDPSAVAAKPTNYPPQQPTYASTPPDKMVSPGPPPSSQHAYGPPDGPPPPAQQTYAPPDGLPPSQTYAPPPGPPPSHALAELDTVGPPPGPPPPKAGAQELPAADDYTRPPPGPPPSHHHADKDKAAASQHDWQSVVPDTSLFPPPPDIFSGFDRSPANNATEAEAAAGTAWCDAHPLAPPADLDGPALGALEYHNIRLLPPPGGPAAFRGALTWQRSGVWAVRSDPAAPDACLIGYPPLYAVRRHSPLATGPGAAGSATAYYEVRVRPDSRPAETSLALGFAALPYPGFRLPGWHRGSLAVHGDDGHRYVNDVWGGHAFTAPFRPGDTYGLGMRLTTTAGGGGRIDVEVFFTRNGAVDGRWNLHEETDAVQDLPVTGLEGFHDLSCAIGMFDAVSFEVIFDPSLWAYKGAV